MAWSGNRFGFQSSTCTPLPQLLDRVRHKEATKQPIISKCSTLHIAIQPMRVHPLGLDLLILLIRGRALVTVITLQKPGSAVRTISQLGYLARGNCRSGALLYRGRWWVRRANGSVRRRRALLCRVLGLASVPIGLGSRGCNRGVFPSLRYPSGIIPGPWK
jgi:hypothetical protein